jgi:CheY-like chemotaxis protein
MKKIKALVVDDIIMNRIIIKEILNDLECDTYMAANGREAINLIKENNFDVVFLDIEMPVMNGLETVNYIRNEMTKPYNTLPVIAITAHDPNVYFYDFRKVGFTNLLTKPYTIEQIRLLLGKIFNNSSIK